MRMIGALVGISVLTDLLNPAQYGEVSLALSFTLLASQVSFGGLSSALGRFYPIALEQNDIPNYLGATLILTFVASVLTVVGGVLIVSIGKLQDLFELSLLPVLLLGVIFALFSGVNTLFVSVHNAARKRIAAAVLLTLEPWFRILAIVLAASLFIINSTDTLIAFIVSGVALLIISIWCFAQQFPGKTLALEGHRKWTKSIFGFAWPFYLIGIFSWAQLVSPRWALEVTENSQSVGFFAVAHQLGYMPVSLLIASFGTYVMPILFEKAGDATDPSRLAEVRVMTDWIVAGATLATLIATLIAQVFHRQIFSIFVASEYLSASVLLPVLVLSGGLFAIAQIYSYRMFAMLKTRELLYVGVLSSVVGIVTTLGLVPKIGELGASYGTLMFAFSYLVLVVFVARKTHLETLA